MMTRRLALALLLLSTSPALADVIELKTGQRVEGTLKQATPASVSVEVGGQTITFEGEKVRAIYFGEAPAPAASAQPPAQDALDALRGLRSVTHAGVNYRDYSSRSLDAKVKVDRYIQSGDTSASKAPIGDAMHFYMMAASAWNAKIIRDVKSQFAGYKAVGADQRVLECPAMKLFLEKMRATLTSGPRVRGGEMTRAEEDGFAIAYAGLPVLWSCASDKIAEAEKLLTPVK